MSSYRWPLMVLGASALCFAGGRWAGARRSPAGDAPPGAVAMRLDAPDETRHPPPPAPATTTTTTITSLPPTLPALAERTLDPEWARAMASDLEGAQAVHQAVIRILEQRRRRIRWDRCFATDEGVGESRLIVSVRVHASSGSVEIGDATHVVVDGGVALSRDALSCIAGQLSGHDLATVENGLHDYDGPVDFSFLVRFTQ